VNPFQFADYLSESHGSGDFVLVLPRDIPSKAELLNHYAVGLNLPEWFGKNWDALHDCLRDLSWLNERTVVLIHEALPTLSCEEEVQTYVTILQDVVLDWMKDESKVLVVVFPISDKADVERIISSNEE